MKTYDEYKKRIECNQEELRAKVLHVMADNMICLSQAAKESNVSWTSAKRFLVMKKNISRETCQKFLAFMEKYSK